MKIQAILGTLLAFTLLMTGCSSGSSNVTVDINPTDAAAELIAQGGFADTSTLAPIPETLLGSYYAMDDAVSAYAIYIDGSGGTAREVAVLKVADAKNLSKARDIIDKRLDTLKKEFENYRPDEMQKISNPLIVEKNDVVYMVLTDDPKKAEQTIDSFYSK